MLIRSLLTVQQRAAIGEVVVESARLEVFVDILITRLARFDAAAEEVFLSRMMLGSKLEALESIAMARLRSRKRKSEFGELISRLKALNQERVIVVHGSWEPAAGAGVRLSDLISGKWLQQKYEVVKHRRRRAVRALTTERVERLAEEIDSATEQLWRFYISAFIRRRKNKPSA